MRLFNAPVKAGFVVCLVLLLSAPLAALAAPVAVFNEDVYDFGQVQEGTAIEHAFTVKNTGDQTLTITRLVPG